MNKMNYSDKIKNKMEISEKIKYIFHKKKIKMKIQKK